MVQLTVATVCVVGVSEAVSIQTTTTSFGLKRRRKCRGKKHQDTKQRKTTIKDCRDISDPIMSRMIGNGKAYKIGNEWK